MYYFFPQNCAPYICSLKQLLIWKYCKILSSTPIVKLFVYKTVKCEVTNVKFLSRDLPLNNSAIIAKRRCLKLLYLSKGMCEMGSQLKKWYISNILETPYAFFSIFSWYLSFTNTLWPMFPGINNNDFSFFGLSSLSSFLLVFTSLKRKIFVFKYF